MHRYYSSDYLSIEKTREHIQHKFKLLSVKSQIDNKPPSVAVKGNRKKRLMIKLKEEERMQNNKILLDKLISIDKEPPLNKASPPSRTGSRTTHLHKKSDKKTRTHTVKSFYSYKKFQEDYKLREYLKQKLSENAGRVPKVMSYKLSNFLLIGHQPYSFKSKFNSSKPYQSAKTQIIN